MKEVNDDDFTTDYGERLGASRFTLGELAEELDVSKGYISRRAGEGKDVKGHDVAAWAVRDGTGRIDHYRVPDSAFSEVNTPDDARENAEEAPDDTPDDARENAGTETEAEVKTTSVRDIAREGRERREQEGRERDAAQLEADRKRRERSAQRDKKRLEAIKARTAAKQEETAHEAPQGDERAPKSDEGGNMQEGTPATRRSGVGASLLALGGAAVLTAFLGSE